MPRFGNPPGRWSVAPWFGVLISLLLLSWGGLVLRSEHHMALVNDVILRSAQTRQDLVPLAWREAVNAAQSADTLLPLRPSSQMKIAQLFLLYSRHLRSSAAHSSRAALMKAEEYAVASVSARPAWPYGWADLALIEGHRLRSKKSRAIFNHALAQALVFGPSERHVLLSLVSVTPARWAVLPADVKDILVAAATRLHAIMALTGQRKITLPRSLPQELCAVFRGKGCQVSLGRLSQESVGLRGS